MREHNLSNRGSGQIPQLDAFFHSFFLIGIHDDCQSHSGMDDISRSDQRHGERKGKAGAIWMDGNGTIQLAALFSISLRCNSDSRRNHPNSSYRDL
jgi:hypothetical protein